MNQIIEIMKNWTKKNLDFGVWRIPNPKLILLLTILLAVVGNKTMAQSLDDYLTHATENSPLLKASYSQYLASKERIDQPGLPDPELQVGVFLQPMERYMGTQLADYRLMQSFPWFGTIKAQKSEADFSSQAQYQLFMEVRNELFFQIKYTWFDLHRIQGEIDITKEILTYFHKLEELALTDFKASTGSRSSQTNQNPSNSNEEITQGKMSEINSSSGGTNGMAEVIQVRLEIKELENQLALLTSNQNSLFIKFNQLINRDIQDKIELNEKLQPPLLELDKYSLLDSIKEKNPMISKYENDALAYQQRAKIARLEGNPKIGLGINYSPFLPRENDGIDHSDHSMDMLMPMVTLSLPIFRNKTEGKINEAKYLQEVATQNQLQTENLLAIQWAEAFQNWEDATRSLELYDQQIELVQQQINLLTTSFSNGLVPFSSVLKSQLKILNYQIKRIEAITLQYQSLSLLEKLSGINLINT